MPDDFLASDEPGGNRNPVHFLRILQWWGKTAKGPIFRALPQHSMRSQKV